MELVNFHCHSGYCGHGEGALADYIANAQAAGITHLALTEHFPLSLKMDPHEFLSVPASRMDSYVTEVKQLQEANPDFDLLLGIELDYLGDLEDRQFPEGCFDPFQVVLGSVHFIDGWAFDDPDDRGPWDEPGAPDAIWKRYFELWLDAVSDKSYPFQIMSHPDLAKKFGYYPTFDLQPYYQQAAEAAAAADRMIELNTSGARKTCGEMYPSLGFLREFNRAGVPCSLGTDAHHPVDVAAGILQGYDLLREAGYREVTILTKDGDRRPIPLT